MKRCPGCNTRKPLDQFHRSKGRPDGRNGRCKECHMWDHKFRKYGVTKRQYQALYEEQAGICPLCLLFFEALCIDHDHNTGKVRGLLCISCNRALGYFENIAWHKRAEHYLAI